MTDFWGAGKSKRTMDRWGDEKGYGKLVEWVEEHVEETLAVYRLPEDHRLRMKSTNMLERLNGEIRWWARVVRIFSREDSCLRLARALTVTQLVVHSHQQQNAKHQHHVPE